MVHTYLRLLLLFAISPSRPLAEWTEGECKWDLQCEALYKPGSKCLEGGMCSNPYVTGCMNHYHIHTNTNNSSIVFPKRTCNSKDDTIQDCEPSILNYPEVRIHNANWESGLFYAWIVQIFLSEFLQVPTTAGMGTDSAQTSFYASDMPMAWSDKAYAWEEIEEANRMGGRCDLTDKDCVHVLPEVWNGQRKAWQQKLEEGHIDQLNGNGEVGKISLYIPVYTAEEHPEVVSYHGIRGKHHRLASIFNRPTTWQDYCKSHSPTNCTQDDGVASRLPADEVEGAKYFLNGAYTGFFRPTEKNDCSLNPNTCSGHIVGSPCGWSTHLEAQLYWNNIPLESNGPLEENSGYSYGDMIDIWRAANATKSHVVMWWWTPDATVEEFRGTQYEFQSIILPEPTAECRAARIDPDDRCSLNPEVRRGKEFGGCDDDAHALQTVVASSLRDLTYDTPEVDRSPGYQAILNLKISQLDMNILLQKWVAGGRTGYAGRLAVCEWVIEHQDDLNGHIPRGYPRVFASNTSYDKPQLFAATAVGGLAILYVLLIGVLVYRYRSAKVFVYAQVPFVYMVLLGILLVANGSILVAREPSNSVCVGENWFITLGYTLELVPLLVKIAAINHVLTATKQVRIDIRSLFRRVVGIVVVVIGFLAIWTTVDPAQRREGRYLKEEGDTMEVTTTIGCASDSTLWGLAQLCWNGILVLCATVLAFHSRNVKQEFNDSKSLGTMIYSHFMFAALRVVVIGVSTGQLSVDEGAGIGSPTIDPSILATAMSFLLSLDVITAVTIYVVPKLNAAHESPQAYTESTETPSTGIGIRTTMNSRGVLRGSAVLQKSHPNSKSGLDDSHGSGKRVSFSMPRISSGSSRSHFGIDDSIRIAEADLSWSSSNEDDGGPRFDAPREEAPESCEPDFSIHVIREVDETLYGEETGDS